MQMYSDLEVIILLQLEEALIPLSKDSYLITPFSIFLSFFH